MKTLFKISFGLFAIIAFSFSSFAQDVSIGAGVIAEPFGQVNFPSVDTLTKTITHSVDPDSVLDYGSIACRGYVTNYTTENHYWRSFVLTDFNITHDFTVTLVDIGIQQALAGSGGVQPMTCNLYITDGTPFPGGYPNSLIPIGTTTLDVPDQAISHFPIPVSGTAPTGSELVVEILIPHGVSSGNIFFIGINHFGETAQSYFSSINCDFPNPVPPPALPDQHYVMSVTGDIIVPVELTSFTANVDREGAVILKWSTATEVNNQMFEIERKNVNGQFFTIGYVDGFGTTTEQQKYSYIDNSVGTGTFFYRLKQIDYDGTFEYSSEIEVEVNGPLTFVLEQNYPNPFNPTTNISYTLPTESQVKLSVYNPLGEMVETIVNDKQNAGKYNAVWNANHHPSGVYIYTLDAISPNGSKLKRISKKMLLLK